MIDFTDCCSLWIDPYVRDALLLPEIAANDLSFKYCRIRKSKIISKLQRKDYNLLQINTDSKCRALSVKMYLL